MRPHRSWEARSGLRKRGAQGRPRGMPGSVSPRGGLMQPLGSQGRSTEGGFLLILALQLLRDRGLFCNKLRWSL